MTAELICEESVADSVKEFATEVCNLLPNGFQFVVEPVEDSDKIIFTSRITYVTRMSTTSTSFDVPQHMVEEILSNFKLGVKVLLDNANSQPASL